MSDTVGPVHWHWNLTINSCQVRNEDAKCLLFEHLEKNATFDTLREYCEVAISADGFPRMQAFGWKIMETLSLGGLLELWV